MKGTMLLPSSTISESELDWNNAIDGFIQCYTDEIPSSQTLDAEKLLWKQLRQEKFRVLKQQHTSATGEEMNLSTTELKKMNMELYQTP